MRFLTKIRERQFAKKWRGTYNLSRAVLAGVLAAGCLMPGFAEAASFNMDYRTKDIDYTEFGNISNSYNRGIVTATSSFKGKVYAAGLYNQTYNVFDVIDSYNIGKVSASGSAEGADVQVSGLIPGKVDLIDNSYVLDVCSKEKGWD